MTKSSKKFVQPGCLSQKRTRILDQRQKTMDRNAAVFSSLGLKDLANGLFGSNLSTKKKSSKSEKSKMGCANDDEEYQPVEEEEGMSSSSEGVVSSRLQGNKAKSDRGKYARSKVKFNHTSGSRSFASRASMILKKNGKKQNIAEKFEITHKRHRYGGEWINDKAKERHAQLEARLKEQSQPDITNPLSEEQISIDVLGKRSVYVKEYGSRRSTISSSKAPEEVAVLQQKLDDQAKTLTKNSRTLAKYSRTMTVVQGLLQVLAAKVGIDPVKVQDLIDGSNAAEGTSGDEDGVASTSSEEDDIAGTSNEEDDATSTG